MPSCSGGPQPCARACCCWLVATALIHKQLYTSPPHGCIHAYACGRQCLPGGTFSCHSAPACSLHVCHQPAAAGAHSTSLRRCRCCRCCCCRCCRCCCLPDRTHLKNGNRSCCWRCCCWRCCCYCASPTTTAPLLLLLLPPALSVGDHGGSDVRHRDAAKQRRRDLWKETDRACACVLVRACVHVCVHVCGVVVVMVVVVCVCVGGMQTRARARARVGATPPLEAARARHRRRGSSSSSNRSRTPPFPRCAPCPPC
jgi:hypothetical protein